MSNAPRNGPVRITDVELPQRAPARRTPDGSSGPRPDGQAVRRRAAPRATSDARSASDAGFDAFDAFDADVDRPPPPDDEVDGDPGDPESVARAICLRLLTQRARSRAELATALTKRGVPDDAAAAVLDRFTEVGLIDDAALAQQMAAASHRERGLAGRAVAQKLRQRGLSGETVEQAVAGIDGESERRRAFELATKRAAALRGLDPAVVQRRVAGLLARKGYGPEIVYDTVRQVLAEAEPEVEA
ncbi:MAG: regulatory protein RecX [Jatrophihabitans sp.]|uniref:regulatory protein RecX n=1 Tax=Jatrophihabitans sp. TaxID=1932789 RepID=UPI003F813F10